MRAILTPLLSQIAGPRGWGFAEFLIAVVVIAAAIALVWVAIRQFGVNIPQWVIQVFWIIVVALVIVFAIRFLFSL